MFVSIPISAIFKAILRDWFPAQVHIVMDFEFMGRTFVQASTVDISLCVATVSKKFKIKLEGKNYVHFYVILSRNVKIFGIMASL